VSGSRRVAFLDVFSERPLAGNGLAVVDDADGVGDEVMLAFAMETRLAETTFVQSAGAEGADYRNRIWTPTEEVPFAGHPSLGTAVAVARWRGLSEASFVQETGAGLQPVEVVEEDGRWRASMLQGEAELGPELDPGATMAAAGLDPGDADPELPPQIASTGLIHAIAPVASAEALSRVRPDYAAIEALFAPHGAFNLYLVWPDPAGPSARARSFAAIAEIGEDPATGSAAGPLCAYLAERRGRESVSIRQGEEMGRPSLLEAAMEGGRVRVSGAVSPLIDGTIGLPG
jgi:trans-2,3-dihydro-3-hydroxyanthranilate isomerase